MIARLDTTGLLDPPFDVVTTDIGGSGSIDEAAAVTLQPDGKLVVSGYSDDAIAVVRYNPDGSLFCASPLTTTSVPGGTTSGAEVALQPDGKIVVAGTLNPGRSDYVVIRYLGSICGDGTTECENDGSR